jgi:hypothetical protein
MEVQVVESFYAQDVVFDVPTYALQQFRNPIYIGARTGQVARVHKIMAEKKIPGVCIGAWELGDYGYLDEDGRLNVRAFRQHGMIFMARSERVHEAMRPAYQRLIETLKGL